MKSLKEKKRKKSESFPFPPQTSNSTLSEPHSSPSHTMEFMDFSEVKENCRLHMEMKYQQICVKSIIVTHLGATGHVGLLSSPFQ